MFHASVLTTCLSDMLLLLISVRFLDQLQYFLTVLGPKTNRATTSVWLIRSRWDTLIWHFLCFDHYWLPHLKCEGSRCKTLVFVTLVFFFQCRTLMSLWSLRLCFFPVCGCWIHFCLSFQVLISERNLKKKTIYDQTTVCCTCLLFSSHV